ncbi:DUF5677 domain-containing protein [Streptomyces sp. NPDC007808]|uniref:DUF5677 domain-containing protein n=1 Tax=Streptomyces sp. NPDC007808 TaxID=3364779 RepID=UPI0036C15152
MRLQPLFDVVSEVITAAEAAAVEEVGLEDRLALFDKGVLGRGIKGLKSARLLIGAHHWEHATAVARQLFELLVNIEHLASFDNRETALKQYNRFGLLQWLLAESRRIDFEKERGRHPGTPLESTIKDFLDKGFDEFKLSPRADGTMRWRTSWSGKTTRTLAELSSDTMRIRQYELLFSAWSEQTHATPSVFATNLFDQYEEEVIADAYAKAMDALPDSSRLITEAGFPLINGARRREAETLSMSVTLFVHLWQQLPNVSALNTGDMRSILRRVREFMTRRVHGTAYSILE